MINQFLMELPRETASALYNYFGYLQWPAYVGILLLSTLKYQIPAKQKVALWVAFVTARIWGVSILPALSRLTGGVLPGNNAGVAFGFVMLILAAIVYYLNMPVSLFLDTAVPAFILGRGLAITGCVFVGCCHGFPVPWGIYSCKAETCVFPTVPLDIAVSCCLVGYLICLAKKQHWTGSGIVAAKGMLLFGVLRIIIDVLRDNQKLFFVLTAEGFFGIAYVVIGYLLLRRFSNSR